MKLVQGQQMCEAKSITFKGMCLKWRNCKQFLQENELIKLSRKEVAAAEEEKIPKETCMKLVQGQQMCEAKSITFKGMCLKWRNCKQVCISEGFPEGRCKGFVRKCVCRKPCLLN
uniref:Knottins-like domain-containing protein n=1 Tax=Brassica oleracea var. oleracea TaxID=109376 RepID=A0A0D3CCJ6_BRAOL